MLSISSTPVTVKVPKVLHLIHARDLKNPMVVPEMDSVNTRNHVICKIGEHNLSESRFNEFDLYILHSVSPALRYDLLNKLKPWLARLHRVVESDTKCLLVYGNMIPLLGEKVFIVPKESNVFLNNEAKSANIDTNTNGLGLSEFTFDVDFDPKHSSKRYVEVLKFISRTRDIYLLDNQVLVSSDGSVKFGTLYKLADEKLTVINQFQPIRNEDDKKIVAKREIPRIHPVYKDNIPVTKDEQKIEEVSEAISTNTAVKF